MIYIVEEASAEVNADASSTKGVIDLLALTSNKSLYFYLFCIR